MNQLDELREILLEEDRRDLAAIRRRVDDPAVRAREMAEILPRALQISEAADDARLSAALQNPVTHCIKQTIQRDTQTFADALFPVMGPAIRRAISEALQGLVESINAAVESSLTPRGLRWRLEAWRTGSSYGSVALKHTLRYRVEQALLIHRVSGLLIDHVGVDDLPSKDNDAVAGMLLVVQDFVRDSFAPDSTDTLETLELGDHFVWVVEGPYAILACVIRNAAPAELRTHLSEVLEDIHAEYGTALETYHGDRDRLPGLSLEMERVLLSERQNSEQAKAKSAWWPAVFLLLAVLGGVGWLGWRQWQENASLDRVRTGLASLPGFIPLSINPEGGLVHVDGLLDPLAPQPRQWLQDLGIDAGLLALKTRPYHSLAPGFILARARAQLRPPAGVQADLDKHGNLRFSGVAGSDWIRQAEAVWMLPDGVRSVDFSGLTPDAGSLLAALRRRLNPPPEAQVSLKGEVVQLTGELPWDWLNTVPGFLAGLDWVQGLEYGPIHIPEWERVKAQADVLRTIKVHFVEASTPRADAYVEIERAVEYIRELRELTEALRVPLRLTVVGSSDGVGDRDRNLELRRDRAKLVAQMLQRRLGDRLAEATAVDPAFAASDTPDPDLRRAWFRVELPREPQVPEYAP
ncbi:MAG: hypothetical protein KDH88_15175 [Chromatiales bacterium]|nr:hypothetical protein [Chromatiales bacterium]